MSKDKIVDHGLLHDFINYKALIEAQANNATFIECCYKDNYKNNDSKPKIKKLTKRNTRNK